MIDTILRARLHPALTRSRQWRVLLVTAGIWVGVAAVAGALVWANRSDGREFPAVWKWLLPAGLAATAVGALVAWGTGGRVRRVARGIERRHPDLDGRLLTAVEQEPGETTGFSLMQERLLEETVRHSTERKWETVVPESSLVTARAVAAVAVGAALVFWWQMRPAPAEYRYVSPLTPVAAADGVDVSPGDTELEKGTALVVLARFESLPDGAELVVGESAESERRIPLVRSMNDPVFGGTLPDVSESFSYRIDYAGKSTRSFRATVFEFPKLERSDIAMTYPEYTGLPQKRIEDTRRLSVVEGTKLDIDLQLNKPVASAVLEPVNGGQPLTFAASEDAATAVLRGHLPTESRDYRLILTDADGRTNRKPDLFSLEVLPNRPPDLRLASPRGDLQPSPLEEIPFDATVWDDFGVIAAGLTIFRPGDDPRVLELGKDLPAGAQHSLHYLLRLEDLNAAPAELVSWHLWADDIGPDGKVRRTSGDLHFGEIRPFDQVFRQATGTAAAEQQQQQGQEGGGGAAAAAASQKDVVNATWKIQRTAPAEPNESYRSDVSAVADGQDTVRAQTEELGGDDPESAAHVRAATSEMQRASEILKRARSEPALLTDALAAEQAAYQALLKLAAREFEVSRQRGQQNGQGQGSGQQQMQLDEMDLANDEDRYERQRQAESPRSEERREANRILSRLQELAQRQEDVNERLKELQSALQEAKTEEEREAARRELKRLEEEQRQMLADVDELQQRMDRAQDQPAIREQRDDLAEARENMQDAAEAAQQGQPGQAAASGTRAQRQMQEMRDELRRQTADELATDLRELRTDAREIARRQQDIARQLQNEAPRSTSASPRRSLSDEPRPDNVREALDRQREDTADVARRAEELSDETGSSEPLISRQLYDAAREFATDDAGAVKELQQQMLREGQITRDQFDRMKELIESEEGGRALSIASEMLEQGLGDQAAQSASRAGEAADRLREGVERAAESVLGDDTAALQAAAAELDNVTRQIEREMQEATGEQPGGQQPGGQQPGGEQPGGEQPGGQQPGGQQPGGEQPGGQQPGGQQPGGEQPGGEQPGGEQPGGQQPGGEQPGGQQPGGQQPGGQQPGGQQPGGQQPGGQQPGGQQPGGQQPGGQQPGGEQPGGEQPGGQQPGGQQPGGDGAQSGQRSALAGGGNRTRNQGDGREDSRGGGGGGSPEWDPGAPFTGPLTGDGFTDWSDRLRDIEDMIDYTDMRTDVASARERARQMRIDLKRDLKKPDWAVVELEIVRPLLEVRQQVREELLRRTAGDAMVPIDRDPVPSQFTEVVERYYKELAK